MIIGTIHIEEAQVMDSHEGFHQFHAEESQEPHGSFEVFWWEGGHMLEQDEDDTMPLDDWRDPEPAGWYWRAGFPGCLPDGEPTGPFGSSQAAHADADEWSPDYDEYYDDPEALAMAYAEAVSQINNATKEPDYDE